MDDLTRMRHAVTPLEAHHSQFFVQKLIVGHELQGRPRLEVLARLCKGMRVLHVGCADWPITDLASSLHLQLQAYCERLDGLDVHREALDLLRPHVHGALYQDWSEVTEAYDIVLVPEVLEHVGDVGGFLTQLNRVRTRRYAITVPDAYSCMHAHFQYLQDAETFVEVVHPDHNCWYTPYTFSNVVRKHTDWRIEGLWFFNRISLLMIASPAPPPDETAADRG